MIAEARRLPDPRRFPAPPTGIATHHARGAGGWLTGWKLRITDPRRHSWSSWFLVLSLVFCAGCPAPLDNAPANIDQANNGSLDTATSLGFDAAGEARFLGTITGPNDVDVYEIGLLAAGDRLIVDVQAKDGNLDPVAAVFDNAELLIGFNDDRAADGSDLNPQLDFVLRADGPYFLSIIAYPGATTRGEYEATVQIERGVGVPAPVGQTVYLDWRGGNNIVVPNVGTFSLRPFNASDVGLPSSQTTALKDRVEQIVLERYAGLRLSVLSSDDGGPPSTPHTTVYFGGSNLQAFAISEQIDSYNTDPDDKAIVFTEGYRGAFRTVPTFEQMAQALGNTVAHEVGHLLGLVHTANTEDLMDTTSLNDRILRPQTLGTAVLDDSVFPFGFQAARQLLEWILGVTGS